MREHTSPLRLVKRAVRLRGRSIRARVAELRAMLGNLDRWVKRMLAHLERGPHGAGFLMCEASAESARHLALTPPLSADTS